MTENKHLFVTVAVSHGDYSHLSDTVATVESHIAPSDGAEIVAKNWHEEPGVFNSLIKGWTFNDGTVVKVSKVAEVLPEEFQVLKRYLGEFQIKIEHKNDWSRN